MPALNYQARFAPLVESGQKRQTIRAMRKRPFVAGDTLYHYTGMRTKACRKLLESVCHDAVVIEMGGAPNQEWVMLNRIYLDADDIFLIARADGFQCGVDMLDWFRKVHGFPFKGQLVRW